jgi:ABC-type Zn uptake system ZnuABC Zn-binding protein ZnuA
MKWPNQHTIVFIGLFLISTTGLQQVPVEIEGKDPKPAQLKTLIEHAKKKHINIIFAQPQFSSRSAEIIRGIQWKNQLLK